MRSEVKRLLEEALEAERTDWLGAGRCGRVNEHNGWTPRDFWLEAWEKQANVEFHDR